METGWAGRLFTCTAVILTHKATCISVNRGRVSGENQIQSEQGFAVVWGGGSVTSRGTQGPLGFLCSGVTPACAEGTYDAVLGKEPGSRKK